MTRTRKALLLASMALVVTAFAVPASASAAWNWTQEGKQVKEGTNGLTFPFEGRVGWSLPYGESNLISIFCTVKATIAAEGPNKAQITEWDPREETCEGGGAYASCYVTSATINAPLTLSIEESFGAPVLKLTKTGGNITTIEELGYPCEGSVKNEWASITGTPTLNENGRITSIKMSGESTEPQFRHMSGSLAPVGALKLGLKKF